MNTLAPRDNKKQKTKKNVSDLTKNQRQRKPKSPIRMNESTQQLAIKIPDCALHYLEAMVNPYEAPAGACVPCDLFPLPSAKVKSFVRGTMELGLSGIGYVATIPAFGNNTPSVYATTAGSVGTKATLFSAFNNVSGTGSAQLPYPDTSFSGQLVAGRIVSYGLRIKYVGQLMTRNGAAVSYEDPDHQNANRFSYDTLATSLYSDIKRIGDDEWDAEVNYSGPVTPSDVEFQSTSLPFGATFTSVIAVSGIAGDKYEFEYYQHSEFIGTGVPNKTQSHADGVMFGKVLEATKSVSAEGPITVAKGPTLWEKFKSYVRESIPQILQFGAGAVASVMSKGKIGPGMMLSALGGLAPSIPKLLSGTSGPLMIKNS